MNEEYWVKLGGEECYEPDELPTALSRDLDCKRYHINKEFAKLYLIYFYSFKNSA